MLALCLESSHTRGMGHLYRGLTLLDGLRARGHAPMLLMNDHTPSLAIVHTRGYAPIIVDVTNIAHDWETPLIHQHGVRLWVNDRLETNIVHATRITAAGAKLVTFDDPGTGATLADLHIAALNAAGAAAAGKHILRGIDYLILNPEIETCQRVRTHVNSLLVTLGGSDTHGVTVAVVKQLAALGKSATVIIGPAFEHQQALAAVLQPHFALKRGVPSMITEMAQHDLAITGGGITPFEANAAGLPCIIIANEPFEVPNGQLLETLGGSVFAGYHPHMNSDLFARDLPIEAMSQHGLKNIGLSGASRVVTAIEALL